MTSEEWNEVLLYCLEENILTLDINEEGDIVLGIGSDCEAKEPHLYESLLGEIDRTVASLASKGMVDYVVSEKGELGYRVSPEGKRQLQNGV